VRTLIRGRLGPLVEGVRDIAKRKLDEWLKQHQKSWHDAYMMVMVTRLTRSAHRSLLIRLTVSLFNDLPAGVSIGGSITTDGTLGNLNASNIIDWNLIGTATDKLAPAQCATRPAARHRPRPDVEICGGEVSFWTSLSLHISLDHLVGDLLQVQRQVEAQCLRGLEVDDQLELAWPLDRQFAWFAPSRI
jgi:hypothetical protein